MRALLLFWALALHAQSTVTTFVLPERFGVSQGNQPVRFHATGVIPAYATHRVIDDSNAEVPWQLTADGEVLLFTALDASQTKSWQLQSGTSTTAQHSQPVKVDYTANYIEVNNGKTGIRIPTEAANPAFNLAPIQNVRMADGSWANPAPSYLLQGPPGFEDQTGQILTYPVTTATGYRVNVLETGPLRFVATLSYSFNRPAWSYGPGKIIENGQPAQAGIGFYRATVVLYAGRPSILLDEETNMELGVIINFASVLQNADRIRYRGYGSSSSTCGYSADLSTYVNWDFRGPEDATRNITQDVNMFGGCDAGSTTPLLIWNVPGGTDRGWYNMLYRSDGAPSSPLVGAFTGKLSQMRAARNSMPGVCRVTNSHAGFCGDTRLRASDNTSVVRIRRSWGIFVGTKADLRDPLAVQSIAVEQNQLTGICLQKLVDYGLDFPDPAGGWQWSYLSELEMNALKARVRDGVSSCGSNSCFYDNIRQSFFDQGRTILDMWRGNSAAAVEIALSSVRTRASEYLNAWANRDGVRDESAYYIIAGFQIFRELSILVAILNDENSTSVQRQTARTILALYGGILWDEDFVPFEGEGAGDGFGTANMPVQYNGYRNSLALTLAHHPAFQVTRAQLAAQRAMLGVTNVFDSEGTGIDSTHYQSALLVPTLFTLMQVRRAGLDGGRLNNKEIWNRYADWELSILTPPEPRFGGYRKNVSNGDGNTASTERKGLLVGWLSTDYPQKAAEMSWGWKQQGEVHSEFFTPTLLAIPQTLTPQASSLPSAFFSGYHATHRSGMGSPHEHYLSFIHGDTYSDHRHGDAGQVTVYANQLPVSLDWNANLYSPHTSSTFYHNGVVLDSSLPFLWNSDSPPSNIPGDKWGNTSQSDFANYGDLVGSSAIYTDSSGNAWRRQVRSFYGLNSAEPLHWVKDTFSGPAANAPKTLTWNITSHGSVDTPNGGVVPNFRQNLNNNGVLPSAGPVTSLSGSIAAFTFHGQTWPGNRANDIDLVLREVGGYQYLLGSWGHNEHSTREKSEYYWACLNATCTYGPEFFEFQQILRVRGSGAFESLLGPRPQSANPERLISVDSCGIRVVNTTRNVCFGTESVSVQQAGNNRIYYFGEAALAWLGHQLEGPQSLQESGGNWNWQLAGSEFSRRTLTLAGSFVPDRPVGKQGSSYRSFAAAPKVDTHEVRFSAAVPDGTPAQGTVQAACEAEDAYLAVYAAERPVDIAACANGQATVLVEGPAGDFSVSLVWLNTERRPRRNANGAILRLQALP